jgi:hypothetical protein
VDLPGSIVGYRADRCPLFGQEVEDFLKGRAGLGV